jgi:hypothetical protein
MDHVFFNMLEHFVVPQLGVNVMIWQQDGPPPHYHRDVMQYPSQTFQGRWIHLGCYISYPPSLTPMDFLFWRFMKDNVQTIYASRHSRAL